MRKIDYRVLFPYAALFVALSFVTMLFVHHGDAKAEAKKGLEAFENGRRPRLHNLQNSGESVLLCKFLNAKRFYRSHSKAAVIKLGVS